MFLKEEDDIITLDLNLEERFEGSTAPHQEETIKRWNDGGTMGAD